MHRYCVNRVETLNWQSADPLSAFSFPWEDLPVPHTDFRALWDDEFFHFRFDCEDSDIVLPDGPTIKDRVLGSDRVEIFFAPDLSLKPYFCLEMSPRGDALAYAAKFYRDIDWSWQCEGLQISAKIEGDHYSLVGSIPLVTLRALKILRGHEIHVGIYRAEFHHKTDGSVHSGWMSWVNPRTEIPDFHVPASFGTLELVS
jgi:hypothetical protein